MTYNWELRNHYELLEVRRQAEAEEVKEAFRLQSQAWAPDKMPSGFKETATRRMTAINAAYAVLSDSAKRKTYDASLPPEDVEFATFDNLLQNVPAIWKQMSRWMKEQDVGYPGQRSIAFTAGDYLERRREPSEKQKKFMLDTWELAVSEGFDPLTDPA